MILRENGWFKFNNGNPKSHWMIWFPVVGYYQPICKSHKDDSDFYSYQRVHEWTENKCKQCEKALVARAEISAESAKEDK